VELHISGYGSGASFDYSRRADAKIWEAMDAIVMAKFDHDSSSQSKASRTVHLCDSLQDGEGSQHGLVINAPVGEPAFQHRRFRRDFITADIAYREVWNVYAHSCCVAVANNKLRMYPHAAARSEGARKGK
jgi:hypothetical protein